MEYLNAFICGGILCAIGQILIDKTQLTPARILTGYVVAGVLISALGLYQPLADWGGAGATVPLTGFGHALAKGVKKAVGEQGWLGILTGGLSATAGGITMAVTNRPDFVFFLSLFCGSFCRIFCHTVSVRKFDRKDVSLCAALPLSFCC